MTKQKPIVDPYLFEHQFERFRKHVIEESGLELVSFNSNPYTEKQEGYKYQIHSVSRSILDFGSWSITEIGRGKIIKSVIDAIEIKNNNLVQWQPRYGEDSRQHQPLYESLKGDKKLILYEKVLFNLYRDKDDKKTFEELVKIFGHKYPIIAYLFFLKDRTRYMPIAPTYFDKAFEILGVNLTTSHKCSWNNYQAYNNLLGEIKALITEKLQSEISLLDAHSFTWMLGTKLARLPDKTETRKYTTLSSKDKKTIVNARIGQGRFRNEIINYWTSCAITDCDQLDLLIASHIKPWVECNLSEVIDPYNGLLLSPSLDSAFDAGYITFSNEGKIDISQSLSDSNQKALGIDSSLKLRRVSPKHVPFLEYHRKNVFEKFKK
jgi:hypothetical protein